MIEMSYKIADKEINLSYFNLSMRQFGIYTKKGRQDIKMSTNGDADVARQPFQMPGDA